MADTENSPQFDIQKESKFNLNLSTLEAIHNCLEDIRKINVHYEDKEISLGKSQHIKYKLCTHFFLRARPLLKDEEGKEMKKELDNIKIKWKSSQSHRIFESGTSATLTLDCVEAYNPIIDSKIDEFIMKVEIMLQKEKKIFSSPKGESSLF